MKPTSVKVTAHKELNTVVTPGKNNPAYGSIRVEQKVPRFDGRFLRIESRSAFINGTIEDLTSLQFTAGQELPGKIVVIESLTPPNPDNVQQSLKIAGDSKVICTVDDQPIYRSSYYTTDMKAEDILIAHDNSEEIKVANRQFRDMSKEAVL